MVAGIVVLSITSFAIEAVTNPLLMRMFPEALPNESVMHHNVPVKLLMSAYSLLCIALGGYVTAWIAPRAKVWHAVIMGAIQVVLIVMAMSQYRDHAPMFFWILGMIFTVPAAWCGGIIFIRRAAKNSSRQQLPEQVAV